MPWTPGTNLYFALSLLVFLFILIVRSVALEIYNNWGSAKVVVALDPEKATSALRRSADLLHSMLSGIKLFWIMEKVFSEPYVTTQMSDSTDKPSSCAQKLRSSNNAFKHLSRRKLSFGEKAAQKQQINGTATLSQKQQYSENNNIWQNNINNRNLVACPAVPVYGDEHERMRYEWTRFESFYRVPETDLPPGTRPIHLAQGGFYFGRISRLVRCFSCGERHPTHLHGCTRMVENVPFCKPPSPPPTHSPDNPSLMNVVTRPQCSCCAQKACIGSDPCLLGFASSGSQTDGLSSTSQAYPASPDNRPRNDPIRHVTSGEADEALARMASAPSSGLNLEAQVGAYPAELAVHPGVETNERPDASCGDKQVRTCRFCRESPADVTFQPCGHSVSCHACAEELSICPVCKMSITGKTQFN